jgi:hypothetical protein
MPYVILTKQRDELVEKTLATFRRRQDKQTVWRMHVNHNASQPTIHVHLSHVLTDATFVTPMVVEVQLFDLGVVVTWNGHMDIVLQKCLLDSDEVGFKSTLLPASDPNCSITALHGGTQYSVNAAQSLLLPYATAHDSTADHKKMRRWLRSLLIAGNAIHHAATSPHLRCVRDSPSVLHHT